MLRSLVIALCALRSSTFTPPRARDGARAVARSPARRSAAGVDGSVAVRDAGDRGRGVFATAPIANGTYVGEYGGGLAETIDYAELARRYPDLEPEYCFELGDDSFLDAARADHWTRLMNHDATERANVSFELVAGGVAFAAIADIAPGAELVFDCAFHFSTAPAELRRLFSFTPSRARERARARRRKTVLGWPLERSRCGDGLARVSERNDARVIVRRAR